MTKNNNDGDNLITSDGAAAQTLDAAHGARLVALLNTLVPPTSASSGEHVGVAMPGAGDLACVEFFEALPQVDFRRSVELLDALSEGFVELPLAERVALVRDLSEAQPDRFRAVLNHAYALYYQDPGVMRQIGMVGGAPFPDGNSIPSGELSLLDPVIAASHGYRKA